MRAPIRAGHRHLENIGHFQHVALPQGGEGEGSPNRLVSCAFFIPEPLTAFARSPAPF